jgi:hypothetical protein
VSTKRKPDNSATGARILTEREPQNHHAQHILHIDEELFSMGLLVPKRSCILLINRLDSGHSACPGNPRCDGCNRITGHHAGKMKFNRKAQIKVINEPDELLREVLQVSFQRTPPDRHKLNYSHVWGVFGGTWLFF